MQPSQLRQYVDLNTVYPEHEISCDTYKIKTFTLSSEQVSFEKMRNSRGPSWITYGLKSDFKYVQLYKTSGEKFDQGVMMSDTPMERNTNQSFVQKANGDVLIFGLGLGLIILPLLKADEVKSITVVELYPDLIALVEPYLKRFDLTNKLTIVQGDAYKYLHNIEKGRKFDSIYFDIWLNICSDDYTDHKHLKMKYSRFLNRENEQCVMDCWLNTYYKNARRKESKYAY